MKFYGAYYENSFTYICNSLPAMFRVGTYQSQNN